MTSAQELNNTERIKKTTESNTQTIHSGVARHKVYDSLTTPIVQTATYTFQDTAELVEFMERKVWGDGNERSQYGRYANPTVQAVEQKLAALEGSGSIKGGTDALLYASGMAAMTSVMLSLLSTGTHIVMTDDCYKQTHQFTTNFLKRYGIETTVVPMGDYDAMEAACIPKKTRLIVSESPTNPYLRVMNLERLTAIAKANKALTLIDSTFATPVNQRPLEWGVDFVVHSATKYLSGHNDLLAGVVIGRADRIAALRQTRGMLGGVLDPHNAFLLERGIKTLGVRVAQQNRNALKIAEFLEQHQHVQQVWYPGLPSHPDHEIARAQMDGFGGVVTFTVNTEMDGTRRFIDALQIPYIAASLGGVESLIEQPALMSYYEKTREEREAIGIPDNLVRFAVGIEDSADLIADLGQALSVV